MAVATLNYYSPSLGKQTTCNVIIPEVPEHDGPFPVYYLLHGLSDDYSIWQRKTSLGRYVQMLPLIVVMPDGGRGFYCDAHEGFAYESAIIKDLIPFVDRTFHTISERGGRAIGGLSMGGYGAIKLALKFPELFVSANGHSGAYGFSRGMWRDEEPEFQRIFGPDAIGGQTTVSLWRNAFALRPIAPKCPRYALTAAPAISYSTRTALFTAICRNSAYHTTMPRRPARTTGRTGTNMCKALCAFIPNISVFPNRSYGLKAEIC